MTALLTRFHSTRPRFQVTEPRPHTWLAAVHAEVEDIRASVLRSTRTEATLDETVLYDLPQDPRAAGPGVRTRLAGDIVDRYFQASYAHDEAPDALIHVTCGGHVLPSGAQKLVAAKRWGTAVTHAYRLGEHAAIAAIERAIDCNHARVDIAHTELGALTPAADRSNGLVRYSVVQGTRARGLAVLATHQLALPGLVDAITLKVPSDDGVPAELADALRSFIDELFARAEVRPTRLSGSVLAIQPATPTIIDRVSDVLALDPDQVLASRGVYRDLGNMASATLPAIWGRVLADPDVATGTLVPSLAFYPARRSESGELHAGPGATLWGALLVKR